MAMTKRKSNRWFALQASLLCGVLIGALPGLAGASDPPAGQAKTVSGGSTGADRKTEGNDTGTAVCDISGFTVKSVAPKGSNLTPNDVIKVEVDKLDELMAKLGQPECKGKRLALFFGDQPMPDLTYRPIVYSPKKNNLIYFSVKRDDKSQEIWRRALGVPTLKGNSTLVSIGLADGIAIGSDAKIRLNVIPEGRFYAWLAFLALLLIAFLVLAFKSDLLRDAGPSPGCGERRPFSLARTQGAWWFFIILASYLLIGLVTGDYLTSITAQALVLLGISAFTVVGGAAIDAGKQTPQGKAQQANAEAQANGEVVQAKVGLQAVQTAHDAQTALVTAAANAVQAAQKVADTSPGNAAAAQAAQTALVAHSFEVAKAAQTGATVSESRADLAEKQLKLNAARNQTESFFIDILSDADGVSFHRFQAAAWTVVLGIVFGCMVWRNLEMPAFNDYLLALMGISSGTYLWAKTTEAKVPTP